MRKVNNPHLKRMCVLLKLKKSTLIEIARTYYFPVELIDCLTDFLEAELAKILIDYSRNKPELLPPPDENSDEFYLKLFESIESGTFTDTHRKFYDKAFGITEDDLLDWQRRTKRISV